MRRGHSGNGGWRNDNPRHFRPRGGGVPRYGPPQPYPRLDMPPKYGSPRSGPRFHRGAPHYNPNRYTYRKAQESSRYSDRGDLDHNQFSYPPPPLIRHNDASDHVSPYKNMLNFCETRTKSNQCHINIMGDVDLRPNINMIERFEGPLRHPLISPWANPIENRTIFENRSPHKQPNRYHDNMDGNQIPTFAGHRPPTSDDYGGNISSAIENSNSFSRSVDDTVDIVRKRLLNRNESQNNPGNIPVEQNPDERPDMVAITTTQNEPQTPPARKRIQRRGQNVKSNCDKIKNKIVHQLFKMDKEKIHKLMDNPSSSTKFEFAISSLITESQNSLDRHLRSVAEKSLCSSSAEFIRDDNNTIYEDTFLKQMQCILEPQDTVLLEDIKPLVMAELTKVLQLDEFDQRFDLVEEDPNYYLGEEQANNINYPHNHANEIISKDCFTPNYPDEHERTDFSDDCFMLNYHHEHEKINFSEDCLMRNYPEEDKSYYQEQQFSRSNFSVQDRPESPPNPKHDQQLYERRAARKSCDSSLLGRDSAEKREQARRSAERERKYSEERRRCETPLPVFETNVDQLSEEEDPFADLDKQYHVAVDRNFIEAELDKQLMTANENSPSETGSIAKTQQTNPDKDKSPVVTKEALLIPKVDLNTIKKEIDNQILTIAKSPVKLCSSINKVKRNHSQNIPVKTEHLDLSDLNNDASTENFNVEINKDNNNQEQNPEIRTTQKENEISENSLKSTILSNARKRSIDQKPLHRKEKRKKSETSPVEPNKQILNKNIIINVNDCGSKSSVNKCDAGKSIFNLFFSKDEGEKELPKENKTVEIGDKGYSDKYVKRKETPIKKENESKRKRSSSTSHSIVSPKENNTSCSEPQSKVDSKIKLKPINMFVEHPKKISSSHQAHRNTAQAVTPKKVEDKPKAPKLKSTKRHVGTQVLLKMSAKETQTSPLKSSISKLCQTEIKKYIVKATQTNPETIEKSGIKSSDAFERMKEIDLEIQVLLQEKFKLYNSLEAKESCSNAIQNLGMTVLNVTPVEESKDEDVNEDALSADAIIDDFTSIPVEELEQIALEPIEEVPRETPKIQKRSQRQKISHKRNTTPTKSRSPTVTAYKNDNKANTPNISLIEQIITDDRPLEDIISLDDLESIVESKPATKSHSNKKKKSQKSQRALKKKSTKKTKTVKPNNVLPQVITRECSVVLNRVDCTKYQSISSAGTEKLIQKEPVTHLVHNVTKTETPPQKGKVSNLVKKNVTNVTKKGSLRLRKKAAADLLQEPVIEIAEVIEVPDVADQTVVSDPADIQFDMLDVSEDIVIGNVCEIKSSEEKDLAEREDLLISDDIILDNSQSSCDDVMPPDAGQNNNECRMFDYSADEMLRRDSVTVTGNADAVLAIECIENNFIAACLDGNVYHFNSDGQLLATLRGSNLAVTCLTIVKEKYGTTVYTGSLDSRIRYYDLETGLEKGPECNVLSPIQTMDRAWDTVFVGTRTGFVLQFECRNNMLIPVSTVKFSEQSILALRALKEGPRKVLLVAARSENVTIKDAQTGLLLRTLEGPKMTVYTLLFEDGKVYCGTSSHQIHVFDYSSGSHCGAHEGGKGCVCLRAAGGLLFAGCYDGAVYVFREGGARPLAQLRGPGLMLLSLAVVGTKVIAGYKDRSLFIWKIPLSILKEMIL